MIEIDLCGVAEILIKDFKHNMPGTAMLPNDIRDVYSIARLLEKCAEPELINECMNHEFGRGLLVGIITTYYVQTELINERREKEEEETD